MPDQASRVALIIGSTRNGRFAPTVARWFANQASSRADVALDIIDLADVKLPDTLGVEGAPAVAEMSTTLSEADAFVVITPEYNHSYPAPLKNAIDWHHDEWQAKPVAFVSYGGIAGGLRAVEHLRAVFAELHAVPIRETVSFHGAHDQFGPDGELKDPKAANEAVHLLLDQLVWWARALTEARAKRPYPA
ncbi:NADPH-dependent FMN reductase [Saccharomonospora saliphila]|uniref:NADPH-dependent FMN reductase n=1 Tax=Saccharomonospora saliphila TaxID=369829 RepID=UPI0003A38EC9|nr:NAD(P)H-dependent oxidoreductase [Saccharomonospora saliphila]